MMVEFIASRIEEARQISLEAGIEKYKAYFVKNTRYEKFREDVDGILIIDGYGDCIIRE